MTDHDGASTLRRGAARAFALAAAAAVAGTFLATSARAQTPGASAGAGVEFQVFDFNDPADASLSSVTLLTVPVGGRVALTDQLTVEAGGYYAHGEVDRPGGRTSELSGLTDINVRASLKLANDQVTLTALGRLPTGEEGYTVRQLDVLGVVSSDLFPFRVSNWGSGGGLGLRASAGQQLGAVSTAVSVGYFRSGTFDPLQDELVSYRPGDNLQVQAAASIPVGGGSQFSLQSGYQWFADDELQDRNVFEPGSRWNVRGRYSFPVGRRAAGYFYGGFHHRDRGRPLELFRPSASQDLVLAGGGLRLRVGGVRVRPTVDARLLRRGDDTSEGEAIRVGGEAEWRLEGLTIIPSLRGHLGSLTVREDTSSGFVGLDIGVTLRSGGGFP